MLKNLLNSLAAVICKNKRNAAGNSEKVMHPWSGRSCKRLDDQTNGVLHAVQRNSMMYLLSCTGVRDSSC